MSVDQAAYEDKGYAFPVQVLDPDAVGEIRNSVLDFAESMGGVRSARLRGKPYLLSRTLAGLIREPKLVEAAAEVLGPNVLCTAGDLFIKDPDAKSFVAWHQDGTFWNIEPLQAVTVWLALSDVTATNGPLSFVPGSHRAERPQYVRKTDEGNMLLSGQTIENPDVSAVESAILPAGSASLHHPWTVHGSGPNEGPGPRIGFAVRYIATNARPVGADDKSGRPESATLVHGVDEYHYYEPEIDPREVSREEAQELYEEAFERHIETEYKKYDKK